MYGQLYSKVIFQSIEDKKISEDHLIFVREFPTKKIQKKNLNV
jgi:hypothetical protein